MNSDNPIIVEEDPSPIQRSSRFDWRQYWYIVLKRRRIVLATFAIALLLTGLWTFTRVPSYRAHALVQIEPGRSLLHDVIFKPDPVSTAEFYTTQYEIMTSPVIVEAVVDRLDLTQHPSFQLQRLDMVKAKKILTNVLRRSISVGRVRNSHIMEVAVVLPDGEVAAEVVNTLVVEYQSFHARTDSGLVREESDFIREQIEKLQSGITSKEDELRDFSQAERVVLSDEQSSDMGFQRLTGLNAALTRAESERAAAQSEFLAVRDMEPADMLAVQNSAAVAALRSQLRQLKDKHAELSAKFKPGWPEIQRTEQKIAQTEEELQAAETSVARNVIAEVRSKYEASNRQERLLRQAVESQKDEFQETQGRTSNYQKMRMEVDSERQLLRGLMRRRSENEISADLKEQQPIRIRTIAAAKIPDYPFAPNLIKNGAVGFVFSLGLAFGVAFLLNYCDSTLWTIEDLRFELPSLPFLGMIPRCPDKGPVEKGSRALTSGRRRRAPMKALPTRTGPDLPALFKTQRSGDLRTIVSERFRFLRGSVLLSTPNGAPKTILVTSPDSGSGKTFVSSNLAASLVQLGKRVLLVDADLRNPQIHKVFRYRNRVGLTNVLTGQTEGQDWCVVNTETPNLFLLMAGPITPSPGELLSSSAMIEALETFSSHFDFVVLDSAPLLPVFDTHVLTRLTDAVLLLSRSGTTTRHALNAAVDSIQRARGKVTGIVLNDVDLQDMAVAQYYGTSYYAYYGSNDSASGYREPVTVNR